jgi:hypothetical protein
MEDPKIIYLEKVLPLQYFQLMDKEDYKSHYQAIKRISKVENQEKTYHFKGDIEDFYVHKYCREKLQSTLLKVSARVTGNLAIYRVFANREKDFILSAFYKNIEFSNRISEFSFPAKETIEDFS